MTGYSFAIVVSVALILFLLILMRRKRLREKYAAIWLVVGLGVCIFAAFPSAAEWLARLVGVQTPSNLVFSLALLVLLLVCVQLSANSTSLEDENRVLTEEVALLRFDVDRLRQQLGGSEQDPGTQQ